MNRKTVLVLFIIFILNVSWITFFFGTSLPPDRFSGKIEKIDILDIEKIGEYLIYNCNFTLVNEINFTKIFKINEIQLNLIEEGNFYSFKVNQFDMLSWFSPKLLPPST
ncbi:MAG: hypothetical protein GTN80_06020 [Nitrososphaeria archaeon]|nr:hypothetical protein [Nitrososphaeria archaeon]NIQ33182.1 hypothetical protein [Nitrososphaeria archaeon]